MKKRILSLLLAALMLLPLCLSGAAAEDDVLTSLLPQVPADQVLTDHVLPLTTEKKELTVWLMWSNAQVADPNTMENVQYLEKLTGIHLNFITVTAEEAAEKYQMLQASAKLPDIIIPTTTGSFASIIDNAINDGWAIDMGELIAKYMPNYRAYLASHPREVSLMKSSDGRIKAFAGVPGNDNEFIGEQQWCGLCVRSDLLEKAGYTGKLETIEDYHNMLLTCKQNLENLSMPLYVASSGAGVTGAFMSAYGVSKGMMSKDGKVFYGPAAEGYGQWLNEMRTWYAEGLIDPNFDTVSGLAPYFAPASVVGTNASVCFTTLANCTGTAMPMVLGVTTDPTCVITPVLNPVLHEGDKPMISTNGTGSGGLAITGIVLISADCKEPELAAQLMDFLLSKQGMLAIAYGEEGVSYDVADDPEAPFQYVLRDGYKSDEERATKLGSVGLGWYNWDAGAQAMAAQTDAVVGMFAAQGLQLPDSYQMIVDAKALWDTQEIAQLHGAGASADTAPLTEDESASITTIVTDIATRVSEYTVQFIKGQTDEPFEQFVQELENMGLQTVVDTYQAAFDRFASK